MEPEPDQPSFPVLLGLDRRLHQDLEAAERAANQAQIDETEGEVDDGAGRLAIVPIRRLTWSWITSPSPGSPLRPAEARAHRIGPRPCSPGRRGWIGEAPPHRLGPPGRQPSHPGEAPLPRAP